MQRSKSNDAPQDADPPERCVLSLPMYRTAIGDAIFPGDDLHTLRMRSDFSEMLLHHLNRGGVLELAAIGSTLAEFTPKRVSATTHIAWKHQMAREWEQRERKLIFAAMEEFFLDGGLESRIHEQCALFVALQAAGIRFGNSSLLFDRALHAGDWRKKFTELTVMGRQDGIRLSGGSVDRLKVAAALHDARFSRAQQQMIWGSLQETKLPGESLKSSPQQRGRRYWIRLLALAQERRSPRRD